MIVVSQTAGSSVVSIHFSHMTVGICMEDAKVLARLLTHAVRSEEEMLKEPYVQPGMKVNTNA